MAEAGEKSYRFGAVRYTATEVKEIARRHGEDGILYYPPTRWGPVCVLITECMDAYDEGYKEGRAVYEKWAKGV